ncbi:MULTISPECIES: hypothetical protein [Paenibacillus]|jgi:hypothetical protein|uniref:hypothetical protein n=1 Tax=Paenibacillus TaxID=44249 RepID=UPI0004BCCC2E|nr:MULTISPECIES: hypothetical protein [Paenibacillus]
MRWKKHAAEKACGRGVRKKRAAEGAAYEARQNHEAVRRKRRGKIAVKNGLILPLPRI